MVGRPGKYQPRFTSGQLDPLIQSNTDESIYFTGASLFQNVKPIPQGGFKNRDGMMQIARIRNVLTQIAAFGAVTSAALTGPAVLLQEDLGAAQAISAIDLTSFSLSAGIGTIEVDTSIDGVTWSLLQSTQQILSVAKHTRRLAAEPGKPIVARYVRVAISNLSATGMTATVGGLVVWTESATLATVRIRAFTYSKSESYDIVFTDGNADVYGANGRVGSIAIPYAGTQITEMKNVQQLDTMLAFHQQIFPQQLLRAGSASEWSIGDAPFDDVPNYDFGDATYSNFTPAQWNIQIFNGATSGNHFTVTVNDQTTAAVAYNDDGSTVGLLQDALLALPGIKDGLVVNPSSTGFAIVFGGIGNQGNGWAVSGTVVDNPNAAVVATQTVVGIAGGEPIMSATRGYPTCGCFFGQRTLMAGFKSAPNVVLASETGNYYELDTTLAASSAPMLMPLDTIGSATVLALHKGRTLEVFCDAEELWFNGSALDRTATPNFVSASTNGIAPTAAPVESGGSTFYASASGGTLLEFKFDYSVQNYQSNDISIQSASIVVGITDMAMRGRTTNTDVDELYCVKSDGSGLLVNLLLEQEIKSFAPMSTDGSLLAVNVNARRDVTFATSRLVNGTQVQFLERMQPGLLFDQAQSVTLAQAGRAVSGLADLEGATVWALADQYVQGPFTVTDGSITLNFAAKSIIVGRWSAPVVKTLPQPKDIAPRTVSRRPCRVHTVRATTVGTSSIAIGANDLPPYEVALQTIAQPTDRPLYANPYTGPIVLEGLDGFSQDGIVEITQLKPGLLTCTGVTVEVDL